MKTEKRYLIQLKPLSLVEPRSITWKAAMVTITQSVLKCTLFRSY